MSQVSSTLETTVTKLWEDKKYNTLRDVLSTMQPASAAELLAVLPENAPAPPNPFMMEQLGQ